MLYTVPHSHIVDSCIATYAPVADAICEIFKILFHPSVPILMKADLFTNLRNMFGKIFVMLLVWGYKRILDYWTFASLKEKTCYICAVIYPARRLL